MAPLVRLISKVPSSIQSTGIREFGLQQAEREGVMGLGLKAADSVGIAFRVAIALCCLMPLVVAAQGKQAWEEYDRLLESRRNVVALSADDMFGEGLDLYAGGLSFSATDVSIPGNSKLPVSLARKFTVTDRYQYGTPAGGAFGDWEIDIPRLSGVFAPNWHDDRCDTAVPPGAVGGLVPADEFWAGNQAEMPGGGEMLVVATTWPKPSAGGPYKWVTAGNTYFSCLPSIKNGTGQGFLAIDSSGTKYWFDHMARTAEPEYTYQSVQYVATADGNIVSYTTSRSKVSLYVTRVEDRFGNWVTYTYSNANAQPVKLTQITSNDGRTITLQYNTSGLVSSVSDGSHSWSYTYQNGSLQSVTLPDTSQWQFSLASLANAQIQPSTESSRTCTSLDPILSVPDYVGTITHPSGTTATYTVGPQRFGRTNVPQICRNYQSPGVPDPAGKSDDYFVMPVRAWALTLKSRQISGMGLTTGTWTYAWSGGLGSSKPPPGETEPVCRTTTCMDPWCVSDDCAGSRSVTVTEPDGSWTTHAYGTSYRYNEGKLLSTQTGTGTTALRTITYDYNFATSGQPYSARIGSSPQRRSAGWVSEYVRPTVAQITTQDGTDFLWVVAKDCTTTGIYCFDEFARPTKVLKASTATGTTELVPPSGKPALTLPATSTTGSYSATWTAVTYATRYELQERLGTGAWTTVHNAPGASFTRSGATSGSWSYQVRACNAAGCGNWSITSVIEVTLPPSGPPTVTAPPADNDGLFAVSWTSVSGATEYRLEQRIDSGAWSQIYNGGSTSRSFAVLVSGTYDVRVVACNDAGCSDYSAIATTVVTFPPTTAPVVTTPASDSDGTFTVAWSGVAAATEYRLEQRLNGGAWGQIFKDAMLSHMVSGLGNGNYDYRAIACNAGGCGGYSAIVTTVVTFPPGNAPTVTVPASDNDGWFTASWTSVANASEYRLDQRKDSGGWEEVYRGVGLSASVSGLTGGTYDYRARACNAGGCSGYSVSATTVVTLPPSNVPTVAVPATDADGAFTVYWSSVSTATRYEVDQRKDGGAWGQIYNGSNLSQAVAGLANGSYDYRARSCNAGGCGGYSAIVTTVVTLPPGSAPSVTAPASDGDGAFTVNWTGVSTATEYRLEQSVNSGAWGQIYSGPSLSHALSGLANGTYDYRALACNASGCSGYSGVARTTVTIVPPAAPATLTAPANAEATVPFTVSWSSVPGATSYRLERNRNNTGWAQAYSGTATSTSQNLGMPATYQYRAQACNTSGCGGYSPIRTVTVSGQ